MYEIIDPKERLNVRKDRRVDVRGPLSEKEIVIVVTRKSNVLGGVGHFSRIPNQVDVYFSLQTICFM